jgi:hypothetical protein
MIPIGTPRALVYRVRRRPPPVAAAPDLADGIQNCPCSFTFFWATAFAIRSLCSTASK